MVKLSPSILSADFSKLGAQIEQLNNSGADMIHIDVMDGMFVPNISFGIPVIKSIRDLTNLTFDVHLMIEEPGRYVEDFIKAGADIITVHYEADRHIDRTLNYIKELGGKASVALNPGTPIMVLKNLIHMLDMVLIMTVNPGFGGQKFIPYSKEKIIELRKLAEEHNNGLMIQVDGGIDSSNIGEVVKCGADVIVAGSAVFKNGEIENNIRLLREGINK
jgi:ribulose-phosphate 3-epimerase